MSKGLEALEALKFLVDNYSHFEFDFTIIEKELKALEIIKESIELKMSVDEDIACLFVLVGNGMICCVGYVQGKNKIDLLKEVLL